MSVLLNQAVFQKLTEVDTCVNCDVRPINQHRLHNNRMYHRLICPSCGRTTKGWHPIQEIAEIGWSIINIPLEL